MQSDFDYTQIVTSDGAKDVLWDNGGLITQAGVGTGGSDYSDLQDASLGMGTYGAGFQISAGNSLADDFDVAGNWVVNTITFYGYQTGSGPPSTLNEVVFQVWDGDPTAGGSVIFGDMTTNVMVSTTWTNIWRTLESAPAENRPIMEIVADASGLVLPAGTYWVEWSVGGTGASGPWAPPVTIVGEATTGNALQNVGGVYTPIEDGGTLTPQGFPFIIDGTTGAQATNDLGVTQIISPVSGNGLGMETVTVKINNFGTNDQSNFDVSFSVDGGTAVTETVDVTVVSNGNIEYTFTATADLSTFEDHTVEACTMLAGDENTSNDCTTETVTNMNIMGETVYPMMEDYWTGSTDGVTKTQTSLVHAIGDVELGWMKFDISSIPAGATVTSVTFHGYVNETNWPYWSITPLASDPVTTDAATLWAEIMAGVDDGIAYSFNNEGSTFAPGWQEYTLGATVLADATAAVAQGWFAVGCADRDTGETYFLKLDGWNETNMPYLEIEYEGGASEYCEAWGNCDEYISNVLFGDIDNTSDCDGALAYADYTAMSTDIAQGETYPLQVTTANAYASDDYGVWIDWNQNGDFYDAGENVVCEIDNGLEFSTWDITVPGDAMEGETRMRIRLKYTGSDCGDPCGAATWGEVEDYTVNVTVGSGTTADCEDFDALTPGGYVGGQLGGLWTTWSGTPGTPEDALVSDMYSMSPSNSMLIEGGTDGFQLFAEANIESGKWHYSHNLYIPTGKVGYWNIQKTIVAGEEWGFQVMYDDDGMATIDAGAAAAAVIPWAPDTWYHNELIIDLENDWCQFFIDGALIVEYQWTLGTFGTAGLLTVGGANYFANPGAGGTPAGAHFDDVCFGEYVEPEPCENFDALTAGFGVAEQLGGMWTTWSGTLDDDAMVTDAAANSDPNSFVVDAGTVDLIYKFGDEPISTGQHLYSHYMHVPAGMDGYFNVQTEPTPGVGWNIELTFGPDGTGTFAGGATGDFTYMMDEWFMVSVNYDLASGFAQVWFDDMVVLEWENVETIGGIDYYGAGTNPMAYFDDVCFGQGFVIDPPVLPWPVNLTGPEEAEINTDFDIMWDEPGTASGEEGWIQWDAGINNANGIGLTNGGTFFVASRWLPADLADYNGMSVTKMTFFPNQDPAATYVLKIWTGAAAGTEMMSQDVATFTVDEFNEVDLTTPYVIDASLETWFGYEVTHGAGTFPAGCDDGPAVQEFGDQISLDGASWTGMSAAYGLDYNWNIATYVANADGTPAQPLVKTVIENVATGGFAANSNGLFSKKFSPSASKALLGYNVYRQFNTGSFSLLDYTEETMYTDNVPIPGATYTYYVTAVYDEGESGPSNEWSVLAVEGTPGDCEDFDDLTVGGLVAEQLGGMWTTWSGTSADDATVSDMYSNSPDNSFVVDAGSVDLVYKFGDVALDAGQWLYSHYIYVPTGFLRIL